MRRLLIIVLSVFWVSGALAQQYATTDDGKRIVIRSDGTWSFMPVKKTEGSDDFSTAESILKAKCRKDRPDDYSVRAFCEKQQREAVTKLKKGKPRDIAASEFRIVRNKCAKDWPDDFSVRAFCEEQQYKAIRELR